MAAIPDGAPVPVVPTTKGQQVRRALAFGSVFAGALSQVLAENKAAIVMQFPSQAKLIGGIVFLGGLAWAVWQKAGDAANISEVNKS